MKIEPSALLAAIEAQFVAACGGAEEIVETGGFRVHLWTTADAFYRNTAVPIERPPDWMPAIPAMAAAFKGHWRFPVLEYLEERWPDLGPALAQAGFACGARLTAMVCDADTAERASGVPSPLEARHLSGRTTKSALLAYLTALHGAFEQQFPAKVDESDAVRLKRALAEDRTRICSVVDELDRPIAGANLIGIDHVAGMARPVAELSGVWTQEAARGRGLARTVSAALLARFFADGGGFVWLAAENARVAGLYARLGFRPIGHQLRYSRCPLEDHGAAQHP